VVGLIVPGGKTGIDGDTGVLATDARRGSGDLGIDTYFAEVRRVDLSV
jgi:hypothetical protein